jgi:predicted dehydrogenase
MTHLDRRQFLANSGAAGAAVGLGAPFATPRRRRAGEPIRFGVVGTGSRGGDHLRTLARLPEAKVVAVCDDYPPHLEKGQALAGGKAVGAHLDYRELVARADVDAITIASPIHTHADVAIAALQAGKHVLCEKSMSHTIEQGQAMVEAVRKSGKRFQVGLQRRYTGFYRRAHGMVDAELIGKVYHATLQWHRNESWRRPVPKPHGDWTAERLEKHLNHRLYWATSGGLMAELGSHQVDVVNWMLGEVPIAVMGVGGIDFWKDGREVWDNVNVIFEYPSGCKATFTSIQTNALDGATEKLLGDKGTILLGGKALMFRERTAAVAEPLAGADAVDVDGKKAFDFTSGATQTSGKADEAKGEQIQTPQMWHDGTYMQFVEFLKCIQSGEQPFCGVAEGYHDSVCVVLANRAMKTGQRVEFGKELWDVLR